MSEAPKIAVICSCGYDGKLTSPLCPLHGEHGLGAQVDRLRTTNAQLVKALESIKARTAHLDEDVNMAGDKQLSDVWKSAHDAVEEAKK